MNTRTSSSSSESKSLASKVKSVWNTFFRKTETPREIQERHDLYKIALATTFRQLRIINKQSESESESESESDKKAQLEKLYDQAADSLETETKAHELPIRSLRFHCQSLIQPQALELLQTCKDIDDKFNLKGVDVDSDVDVDVDVDCDDSNLKLKEVMKICKEHLLREREDVIQTLASPNANANANANTSIKSTSTSSAAEQRQRAYLQQKLNALQILSTSHEWDENMDSDLGEKGKESEADSFGYHINQNQQINRSIRLYQMINLTRAILIKKKIGYSTLALKSTLPGAGRGVFIDGFAPAGTLLSFFPGQIWPKEYLLNVKATSASSMFNNDPRHQLSIRYDDVLVDSRKAPYTVLDNDYSNAFAIGHIVNHPPPKAKGNGQDKDQTEMPNCTTAMIDFMEHMELTKKGLDVYVPNTYVKPPMVFGPNAMDREKVAVHSFGLISCRDLENEELFYDYRLSPGDGGGASYPSWYEVCDEESVKNRWVSGD